jgi:hypothetical protein
MHQLRTPDCDTCETAHLCILTCTAQGYIVAMCPAAKQLLIAALCVSSCAITGCIESSFHLASESRLPRWIALPPGLTRKDVSVTLNYYSTLSTLADDAKFILRDKKGKKLTEVKGKVKHHPWTGYPAYTAVVVNGTAEIIEHRKMEPIFYVNDDPAIRKKFLAGYPGLK